MPVRTRVLFVDDEAPFVENMASLLRSRSFDVTVAYDGSEGIDAFRKHGPFDAVILDIRMPVKDGLTALREIKELEPECSVVILTGYGSVSSGIQAIREGAYDYLVKPCDIEDLTEKLRETVEVKRIRKRPVLWPRSRVEEVTCFAYKKVGPDSSLEEAVAALERQRGEVAADAVFVVDGDENLKGRLTKRDLIETAPLPAPAEIVDWRRICDDPGRLPRKTVKEVMSGEVVSISLSASLEAAADRMISNALQSIPVLREARMLGIARLQDVLLHLE